jgi:hypothetical protein
MAGPRSWHTNMRARPRFMVHLQHGVKLEPGVFLPRPRPSREIRLYGNSLLGPVRSRHAERYLLSPSSW